MTPGGRLKMATNSLSLSPHGGEVKFISHPLNLSWAITALTNKIW